MPDVWIDKIIVDRTKRQRRELTNIEEMMDSLTRCGQIQNIVIDKNYELIVGERRLAAAKRLGWTHIRAEFFENLNEHERHQVELEENIKRVNLDWKDECRAVLEYHQFRASDEAEWSYDKTAEALGISRENVRSRIVVAQEIAKGNEMVLDAPRFSTARGIVQRSQDRAALNEVVNLKQSVGSPAVSPDEEVILHADFNLWAPTYTGPKFNFFHCDFPYGIGANKFNQGAATLHGGYEDTEADYWRLIDSLIANIDRLSADQCHIMFWFSMHFYHPTRDYFQRKCDIRFDPFPLVWVKSDNIGILPDPERGPRRIYETAFFGSRGDRKVVRAVSNAIGHPSQRDEHMSIKPASMLEHFMKMFVDSSTVMLDPTCGSGAALVAARKLGAVRVLGLEKNKEFADRARLLYNANT